jgi:hypothetical protein
MRQGTGDLGIEVVEAAQDFGDALRGEWIVTLDLGGGDITRSQLLAPLRGCFRGFASARAGNGSRPRTSIFAADDGLSGQQRPGYTNLILAAGTSGLAGNHTTRHERLLWGQ